jgi:hypothetical protein
MKDEIIIRMLQDAGSNLEHVRFPIETPNLVPIYNSLLAASQANHPQESFLKALRPVEGASPEELRVLFGQLRILLEALVDTNREGEGVTRPLSTQNLGMGN